MFICIEKCNFMWSEGDWTESKYSVVYVISDSPIGPFNRIGKTLQQDENIPTAAGYHAVIIIPKQDK